MVRRLYVLFLIALSLVFTSKLNAQTVITATASGNYTSTAVWGGGVVPSSTSSVVIPSGYTVNIVTSVTCSSFTLSGEADFTVGSKTLTVTNQFYFNSGTLGGAGSGRGLIAGSMYVNGTCTEQGTHFQINGITTINGTLIFQSATGTKTLLGDVNFTSTGALNYAVNETVNCGGNLIMNPGSAITGTVAGTMSVTSNFSVATGGTVSIGLSSLTVTSGTTQINGAILFTSTSGTKSFKTVNVASTGSILYNAGETVAASGDLNCTGGATLGGGSATGIITVGGNFNVLTGGNTTLNGVTMTVTGNVTIAGSGELVSSSGTNIIKVAGNWASSSTATTDFSPGTNSTVTFNGGSAQTVSTTCTSGLTFYNLTCSNSSGVTLSGGAGAGNLNINSGGTITTTGGLFTASGNFVPSASGTVTIAGTGSLTVSGTTAINNVLKYTGACITTITGSVTIGASGEIYSTAAATINMSNNLSMTSGSIIDASSSANSPIVKVSGTLSTATGTVTLGNCGITVTGTTTVNGQLLFSQTGGSPTFKGDVTVANGGSILFSAAQTVVMNGQLNSNGSSTIGGGSAVGTITVTSNFNAGPSSTGTVTLGGLKMTIGGNITIASGSVLDGSNSNNTISLKGNWASSSASTDFVPGTNTITFNGSTAQTITTAIATGETFYGLTCSNTAGLTVSGGAGSGNLNISGGGTITNSAAADFITVTGNFITPSGSGITVAGTGSLTVNGTSNIQNLLTFSGASYTTLTGSVSIAASGEIYSTSTPTISMGNNLSMLSGSSLNANTASNFATINVSGTLTTATGTVTFGTVTTNITGTSAINGELLFNSTGGTPTFIGDVTVAAGGSILFSATQSIYMNGQLNAVGTCTIGGGSVGTISVTSNFNSQTSGTVTLAGVTLTIGGNLTIQGSSMLDLSTNNNSITLAGNFTGTSSASPDFVSGNNTFTFNGSSGSQTISTMAGSETFYGLTLSNTYGTAPQIILSNNINVSNSLVFTSGTAPIVNLSGNTLTLGTSAASAAAAGTLTHTGLATNGYLYGGTFTRWFYKTAITLPTNSTGLFPIGWSGDFCPFWLGYTSNLSTGGTVSALFTYGNPTGDISLNPQAGSPAPHGIKDNSWGDTVYALSNSTWAISTANSFASNGSTISMRYGGGSSTFGTNTTTDIAAEVNGNIGLGTFAASTSASVSYEVNRTALSTANLGNSWRIGTTNTDNSPLPIELLNFNAVPTGEKVDLQWETRTEVNNAYFTIEKSKDGVNFTKLIDVPGAGNSTSYKDYAETDYQPYSGTSYYRLKQTDNNGNTTYFNIVPVTFNPSQSIVVYPNPLTASEKLNISLSGFQNQEVVVVLQDMQGREFLSTVLLSEANDKIFVIDDTQSLTAGTYIVTATSNDKIYNYKLIVK